MLAASAQAPEHQPRSLAFNAVSQRRDDLPRSEKAAREYAAALIKQLNGHGFLVKVWLAGSRSPLSPRPPREDSDWDFYVQLNRGNVKLPAPRAAGLLHADIALINQTAIPHHTQSACEIWPVDTIGFFREKDSTDVKIINVVPRKFAG